MSVVVLTPCVFTDQGNLTWAPLTLHRKSVKSQTRWLQWFRHLFPLYKTEHKRQRPPASSVIPQSQYLYIQTQCVYTDSVQRVGSDLHSLCMYIICILHVSIYNADTVPCKELNLQEFLPFPNNSCFFPMLVFSLPGTRRKQKSKEQEHCWLQSGETNESFILPALTMAGLNKYIFFKTT